MKHLKSTSTSILAMSCITALLSFVGCSVDTVKSSDVKTTTIYRSYVVTFDQRTLTTSMFANFRVGGHTGTNVELEKPSDVSVSGVGIKIASDDKKMSSALGANYQWEAPSSDASSEVKFLWTRQDSTQVEDKLSPPAVSPISIDSSKSSLASGIVIRLEKPVDPAEVLITVASEAADSKNAFATAEKLSATEYVVKTKDLTDFKPGKIRIESSFTSRLTIPKSDQDLGGIKSYTIKVTPTNADLK